MRLGIAAVLVLGLVPVSLAAQDAAMVARFRAINDRVPAPKAAAIATEAMTLLAAMARDGQVKCAPDAVTIDAIAPATATRLVIDGINAAQLQNGWTARARLLGCPEAPRSRLIVLRMADDSLLVRVVNRGDTLTTASQMRDASAGAAMAAVAAIRKSTPGCEGNGLAMGPTRVASQGADLGRDVFGARYVGSWREVWRFSACGVEADVPIGFKADGRGGVTSDVGSRAAMIVKP
jgi:hypothetical protein